MLQALLVLPAFALVYLVARADDAAAAGVLHLLGAGLALLVSAGWWVASSSWCPASWRPYIGGSQTNSVWELIWGYNGLGRLTGDETGSVAAAAAAAGARPASAGSSPPTSAARSPGCCPRPWSSASPGWSPSAGPRGPTRAARRCCSGAAGWWSPALVFSLMAGIFHAYYTVALAPAIAALVGIGGALLWQRRGRVWARIVLAATLAGTVALGVGAARTGPPTSYPWLKWLVLVAGLVAAVGLLVADRVGRAVAATLVAVGLLAALGGAGARTPWTPPGRRTPARSRARARRSTAVGFGGRAAAGRRRGGVRRPAGRRRRRRPGTANGFPGGAVPGLPGAHDRRTTGRAGGPGSAAAASAGCCDAAEVSEEVAAVLARTRRPTPGSPRPSGPTGPPATSSPPSCR